jgi:hypothetical protein
MMLKDIGHLGEMKGCRQCNIYIAMISKLSLIGLVHEEVKKMIGCTPMMWYSVK